MRVEEHLARRGGWAEVLWPAAALYGAAVSLHGKLHDKRWLPHAKLDAPVVSVGNLTVGGTGKTPLVIWLAREFEKRGLRPGILSRGYSRGKQLAAGELNDEGRLLQGALPGVPQVQQADRIAGGLSLLERGSDVVLLDDGFQHRRLERDLDLVLIDATRPWGLAAVSSGGAVKSILPRGLLRENPAGLARANALILTRADQISEAELEELECELERDALGVPRLLASHRAVGLKRIGDGLEVELTSLANAEVELLSAIGNPAAFERSVEALGARVVNHCVRPDHHEWTRADLEAVNSERRVVTTRKDAVKLEALGDSGARFEVLEIEFEITRGLPVLEALLDGLPESRARRERASVHEGLHG